MEKINSIFKNNGLIGLMLLGENDFNQILYNYNIIKFDIVNFDMKKYYFLTIKEFIEYNVLKPINTKKMNQSLKLVGLNKNLDDDPYELSDSDKYKLNIALSLLNNEQTIILKYPEVYLDNQNMNKLLKLLKKMQKELNKQIIIISKNIDFIYKECKNIVIYKNNEIIFSGDGNILYLNKNNLKKYDIILPDILEFISIVEKNKKIKLNSTYDINELMKDIYRNV